MPVKDTDFGWHYRCGEEFLNKKKLCLKNEFSYFLPDYKASYSSFLFDVPLAFVYDHFGFTGLSISYSILMFFIGLLFINLITGFMWTKIVAFWLMFFLSSAVFGLGLRVQVVSYLFFLITLFIIKKSEHQSKYLLILPLVMFFWANTHLGFFVGLILLIFYIIEDLKKGLSPFKISILFLCFLTTLINPFGLNIYKEIYYHLLSPLNKMIAEWVEPVIWQQGLIILLSIIALFKGLKTKSLTIFQLLLLIFFLYLGLSARRNMAFFYTVFFYIYFDQNKVNLFQELNNIVYPLLICGIIFTFIAFMPQTNNFNQSWNIYCNQGLISYPCEAIKNYPKLSGNVYATYEWGGFLIWKKPKIKVFADGRMPAWHDENGKNPYQVYLEIIQTQPGWNKKVNKLKTNYLLISNGTFLDLLLVKESKKYHWQEVYRDKTAVIYKNTMIN